MQTIKNDLTEVEGIKKKKTTADLTEPSDIYGFQTVIGVRNVMIATH